MDLRLLKEELTAQGDLLDHERLERRAEVDQLRLELETLKHFLEEFHPDFRRRFDELLEQENRTWDPELRRHA